MPSFGERLKRERKARNIRVSQIAETTKISSIYLRALEADDFSQLPGTVFNKGYVRAYAEFIGVDADAMVAAYEDEERTQAAQAQQQPQGPAGAVPRPEGSGRSRAWILALSALGLGVTGAVVMFIMMGSGEETISTAEGTTVPSARQEEPSPLKASAALMDAGARAQPDQHPGREPEEAEPLAGRETPTPEEPPEPAASPPGSPGEEAGSQEPEAERAAGKPPERLETGSPVSAPSSLRIPDSGVGSRVVERRLEDPRTAFSPGEKVHFWARVLGGAPGDVVRHVWIHEGQVVSEIAIDLGGPHWRTYTWQTMRDDCGGRWVVEAREAGGGVLARETFVCRP